MRKNMKKVMALALAASMTLGMTTAFAAQGTNADTGKITINDAIEGQDYTIYQILKLESYNTDAGAYAYKATTDWDTFVNSSAVKGVYFNVDEEGYVTWIENADPAAFAKLALENAPSNGVTKPAEDDGDDTANEKTTVEFTGLNLGYYLVDTTLGSLCSLNTTNVDAVIEEKNTFPTVDKVVEEDSTGKWGEVNNADIGQTVNYKTTITAYPGAQNYILHDKMSAGLTLDAESVEVEGLTENTDYTVETSGLCADCDFHVVFKQDYLDKISEMKTLTVTYSATVNENAVIYEDEESVNTNDTKLTFGDENETEWDQTKTYTYTFNVFKYTLKEEKKVALKDAQFVLMDEAKENVAKITAGKFVEWVKDSEIEKATDGTYPGAYTLTSDEIGTFVIEGIDADTYYLVETKAPDGYNILPEAIKVVVEADGTVEDKDEIVLTNDTVEVENKTGAILPSTGGIGTTIFYVLGGLLVAFSGVVLFAKKRMSGEV